MRRSEFINEISQAFAVHPIVAILGPRQCGKTTLARQFIQSLGDKFPQRNYFDLENPTDLARLANSSLALENLTGLIVIDEIQKIPDLFPVLRVLIDRPNNSQQYLILGSASRQLIHQSSETLAGRIRYIELTPFSYPEVDHLQTLWLRGGFPRSYLAADDEQSYLWREAYIQTFLEQDIPNLGIKIPAAQLRRFWMMLAHYHGNTLNASELGRSLSVNHKTVRNYIDILTGTFMIRELQPWFENISKRQVKSSKIYFRDSGIFHSLLGVGDFNALLRYPKLGASWEGLALEEVIRFEQLSPGSCYYWATQADAELDLLIFKNSKRQGFEFKYTDAPKITKSMKIAIQDLKLDQLTVIFPGKQEFPLAKNVRACGLENYLSKEN